MKKNSSIVFILATVLSFGTLSLFNSQKTNLPSRGISSTFLKFPDQFKWCVATSAHQIEGENTHNDWWA
jgi:hypothetical protein